MTRKGASSPAQLILEKLWPKLAFMLKQIVPQDKEEKAKRDTTESCSSKILLEDAETKAKAEKNKIWRSSQNYRLMCCFHMPLDQSGFFTANFFQNSVLPCYLYLRNHNDVI